ncbi:putative nitrate transporter NarT [compost metagenome]
MGCLAIAVSAGIGNGVIFKLVPFYFNKQAGIANGIVSMMGGLGGFFPPIMLSIIFSVTGQYSIGFMLLSQVALASLVLVIWLYYHDRLALTAEVFNSTAQGILVTDAAGVIKSVNPAFTRLTGFTEAEVLGKQPNVLKSGRQSKDFYRSMWSEIRAKGVWQGEIWNRRKNGEEYLQLLNISAVKDETGVDIRYVGTFSDITQK